MRRLGPPLYGARYCADRERKQIHDLDAETSNCRIDEIIAAGEALSFQSLENGHVSGYRNCRYCIGARVDASAAGRPDSIN
ncbi:MAG: hypothetical protein ACOYLD_13305, partial [Anaerohalosphaeraceae bacterium]